MMLKNTDHQFGMITKVLHWIIALLVLTEFVLIGWKSWILPEKSPLGGFLIGGLHKPLGIIVLPLMFIFILWRILNPHPKFPLTMPPWQQMAAHVNHFLLIISLLIMPIAGVLMSLAAGYPPNFFGIYQIPQMIDKNKELAELCFNIHSIVGSLLLGLIALHVLAALKHHFIDRNDVLKRMLP